LGTQLIDWPDNFIDGLVAQHYHVVLFDNRDVGLSQKFDEKGVADLAKIAAGDHKSLAYTLEDMAADVIGLMDALSISCAHIVGMSMGGMIVQIVAARQPDRLLSATSIMSSSGRTGLPSATPAAQKVLSPELATATRADIIKNTAEGLKVTGSPGFPESESTRLAIATARYDRSYHPDGVARQLAAVVAHGSRVELLATIRVPFLVIHGQQDPLVPLAAGEDTAACIPDCKLEIVKGMGHNIPETLCGILLELLFAHFSGR
jgi:proline iminopeptidase